MGCVTRLIANPRQGPLPIAKDSVAGDTLYVCGCGLSTQYPLCDGSHRAARDEEPGALYHYGRGDGGLVRTRIA